MATSEDLRGHATRKLLSHLETLNHPPVISAELRPRHLPGRLGEIDPKLQSELAMLANAQNLIPANIIVDVEIIAPSIIIGGKPRG